MVSDAEDRQRLVPQSLDSKADPGTLKEFGGVHCRLFSDDAYYLYSPSPLNNAVAGTRPLLAAAISYSWLGLEPSVSLRRRKPMESSPSKDRREEIPPYHKVSLLHQQNLALFA